MTHPFETSSHYQESIKILSEKKDWTQESMDQSIIDIQNLIEDWVNQNLNLGDFDTLFNECGDILNTF